MPDFNIKVSATQAADIALVCALGPNKIRDIADAVEAQQVTIRQDRVAESLKKGTDPNTAAALTRVIFGLSSLSSRDVRKVPDILDGVSKTLNLSYPNDDRFSNWRDCVQPLISLLQSKSVFLAAKATDISYDFERVLTASRILTSIRPVFDIERTKIVGSTVVQTLRVEFIGSEGDQSSLSLAVDMEDMLALREACDDGLTKARLAKQEIVKWSIEAIIPGEVVR